MEPSFSPIAELYQQIITRCLNPAEQALVFEFVQKGNLDEFINSSIEQIEIIVHNVRANNQLKVDQIKTIAYSFLKRFNGQLSTIEGAAEKERLKKLLVKIARGILLEIQQQAPSHVAHVRKAIDHGLEQAVALEGYDQKDFENYFQINYTDITKAEVTVTTTAEITEYFIWNPKAGSLQKLTQMLQKDYYCIKSKSEFELLFDKQQNRDLVRWDVNQVDFLILLINGLYEKGYLHLKGGKGIWKLVMSRFVDFDKNPLDIDPAKRLNLLKGKKPLKPALVANVEKILDHIRANR